jgi:hypothetical protein
LQSAFTITACGYGCTLRPLPLEEPTPGMAEKMALQVIRMKEGYLTKIAVVILHSLQPEKIIII